MKISGVEVEDEVSVEVVKVVVAVEMVDMVDGARVVPMDELIVLYPFPLKDSLKISLSNKVEISAIGPLKKK